MPGARRFEGGSFNHAGANATEGALDLIGDVTVTVIEQHVLPLASGLRSGLAELRLPLIGGAAPERPSQIVVVAPGAGGETMPLSLSDLHRSLTSMDVKLSMRHGHLRLAFHLYNAAEDVTRTMSLISDHLLCNGRQPS